jgi:hypothetical protein
MTKRIMVSQEIRPILPTAELPPLFRSRGQKKSQELKNSSWTEIPKPLDSIDLISMIAAG